MLNAPRWLHHFGPKKYEFYEHLTALLLKHYCRLSYRRIVKLFDMFGMTCPSKSALQNTSKKIPKYLWDKALELTSGIKHNIIAIDGTGISRTNPSYHYLKRIDGKMPKLYAKLSAIIDTRTKKWCSAKVRIIPRHDTKDVKCLLEKVKAKTLVADKAYDAEWIHKYCAKHNIKTHIPIRNYGKSKHKMLSTRRKNAKKFRQKTYNRRVIIESGFHSIKQKYGSNTNSKSARTIRSEIMARLLCHNLLGRF